MPKKVRNIQLPMQTRAAAIVPSSVNEEDLTIDFTFTTGAEGRRFDWNKWEYYMESLEVSDSAVNLDKLRNSAPFLNQHFQRIEDVKGVILDAWIDKEEGVCRVLFDSEDEDAKKMFSKYKRGILSKVSVGYTVEEYTEITNEEDKYRKLKATKWTPVEVSAVAIPFDDSAKSRSKEENLHLNDCMIIVRNLNNEKISTKESQMPKENKTEEKVTPSIDEEKIRQEAQENERTRVLEIKKCIRAAKLEENLSEQYIKEGHSIDKVREIVINKLASESTTDEVLNKRTTDIPRTEITQDEGQIKRESIEIALQHRGDPSVKLEKKSKDFVNMSMLRICEELVPNGRNYSPTELVQRALSTSDLANIASNVAGKSLLKGYTTYGRTFAPFVSFGELADYKTVDRMKFGANSSLKEVLEGGEYEEGTLSDEKESFALSKYGRIISLTEEMILNDDTKAFLRMPILVGAAAARKENSLVYGVLVVNAAMSDGTALFHANHKNLATGAAITNASLDAIRKLGREQTFGDEKLNVEFSYLVTGSNYEGDARRFMNGDIVATKNADVSTHKGSMTPIVDPNVTGNKWFTIADPLINDTIEVAYLKGMNGPGLTSIVNHKTDSIDFKIKHVVKAKALDWRSMAYNPGA